MENQIGAVLHWSHQKEPEQAKSKDEVIRRNLDRIRISADTPLPSNLSRHSQVSLIQKIHPCGSDGHLCEKIYSLLKVWQFLQILKSRDAKAKFEIRPDQI